MRTGLGLLVIIACMACEPTAVEMPGLPPVAPADEHTGLSVTLRGAELPFRPGETIPLELVFQREQSVRAKVEVRRSPPLAPAIDEVAITPLDRGDVRPSIGTLRAEGEPPRTREVDLEDDAAVVHVLLNDHAHLGPGTYRVVMTTTRASVDGQPVRLRTNPIEIEVSPPNPRWETEQIRAAAKTLAGPDFNDVEKIKAARRLRAMGTRNAAAEMVRQAGWHSAMVEEELRVGLLTADDPEVVLRGLDIAIRNPGRAVSGGLVDTVAALGERDRAAVLEEVAAALPHKTDLAAALTALTLLGSLPDAGTPPPWAAGLVAGLPEVLDDLPHDAATIAIASPHARGPAMVPVLASFARTTESPALRRTALKRLIDLDEQHGRTVVAELISTPQIPPGAQGVFTLPAQPLGIDAVLANQLTQAADHAPRDLAFRAKVVQRFAGDGALPAVMAALTTDLPNTAQGPLIAYLLEHDPAVGERLLREETGTDIDALPLGSVAALHYGPAVESVALAQLGGDDTLVTASAAQILGRHGGDGVEGALWTRLERFHADWSGRPGDIPTPADISARGPGQHAATDGPFWVEHHLLRALHDPGNAATTERLSGLCVTDAGCRSVQTTP